MARAKVILGLALVATAVARGPGAPNTFEIVGNSGVSAQQLFLGSAHHVYIVDKTERNGNNLTIDTPVFHPAWSTEYDIDGDSARPMDIITNSFCAGGTALGNGTFLNVGGNNAVGTAGLSVQPGSGPYAGLDGGRVARILDSCPFNNSCVADWTEFDGMPRNRWYPTLITLQDGSAIIIGGELYGGYVNAAVQAQAVNDIEFIPSRGPPIVMPFLERTQPLNLYPLTYLLPNGLLMLQAGDSTITYNVETREEVALADMPHGQRVYPASGGSTTLMQSAANDYRLTPIFCGGLNQDVNNDYDNVRHDVTQYRGIRSCTTITPELSPAYEDTDDMAEGVVMLNLINLPDGRIFALSGAAQGTAGYGWDSYAAGQSYAREPRLRPQGYYNHSAPLGQRWSREGIPASQVARMYHSSATLLPDASIMIAGSNPNADFIGITSDGIYVNASDPYHTEYRVERFYPDYWGKPRPAPLSLPDSINYGGQYFEFTLPKENVTSIASLDTLRVTLVRTGFSTHAINFGQQAAELPVTYTIEQDGTATVHVSHLPPNAAVFAPGPALLFVLMDGVPSIGKYLLVGNGIIGEQPTATPVALPATDTTNGISKTQQRTNEANNSAAAAVNEGGLTDGARKGIIIGGVALGALLLIVAVICAWRRRSSSKSQQRRSNVQDYRDINRLAADSTTSFHSGEKDFAYANASSRSLVDQVEHPNGGAGGYRSQRGQGY